MEFFKRVLEALNINEERYHQMCRKIDEESVENPNNFSDISLAVERIEKAIQNGEKTMIYGDYDCDGIMATSIMVIALKNRGINPGYYIPSRYIDGYGMTCEMVEKIAIKGYRLIITVDNGVAQHDAIALANEKGIDVIVADHHQIVERPSCYALVHPLYRKETGALSCGAYVAFMLSIKLLNRIDRYLLTLAATATISDMMELKDYNRDIVRLGLSYLNNYHYRQFELLKNDENFYDELTIAFEITPKINAVGRVNKTIAINRLVKYFTSENKSEIDELADFILKCNLIRKELTSHAITRLDTTEFEKNPIIISRVDHLEEGLVGLIASRLQNEYQKPCIILTEDSKDENLLIGSARSYQGLSLIDVFEAFKDLLVRSGGHECAGGLALPIENYGIFSSRVFDYASIHHYQIPEDVVIEVTSEELNCANYQLYASLKPFGAGFKEPQFILEIDTSKLSILKEKHIKAYLNKDTSLIGFSLASDLSCEKVSLQGNWIRKNNRLTFKVSKVITKVQ